MVSAHAVAENDIEQFGLYKQIVCLNIGKGGGVSGVNHTSNHL